MANKRTPKNLKTKTSAGAQADAYQQTGRLQAQRPSGGAAARIIAVPLSHILPDPTQARVVLPPALYIDFYFPLESSAPLDCYQVAEHLVEAAQKDLGIRYQVDRLIELGESILQQGQIEPATGYRERNDAGQEFIRLLVGERRFWSLAVTAVRQELEDEPALDVILKEGYSIGEQLAENLQRDDLTAVDLAKGIASLILTQQGAPPDPGDSDYGGRLREVLSIRKLPAGVWEEVQRHIPHSRQHLSRILNILQLPDDLLYVAAISKLPEKVLRVILEANSERWSELIHAAAEQSYTSAELQEAVAHEKKPVKQQKSAKGNLTVHQKLASKVLSLVKLTDQRDFKDNYTEVAGLVSAGFSKPEDVAEVGSRLVLLGEELLKVAKRRE